MHVVGFPSAKPRTQIRANRRGCVAHALAHLACCSILLAAVNAAPSEDAQAIITALEAQTVTLQNELNSIGSRATDCARFAALAAGTALALVAVQTIRP
jgi:hypothetical protein